MCLATVLLAKAPEYTGVLPDRSPRFIARSLLTGASHGLRSWGWRYVVSGEMHLNFQPDLLSFNSEPRTLERMRLRYG